MYIESEIKAMEPLLVDIRHSLHKIPELGMKEYKTSEFIRRCLSKFGIEHIDTWLDTGTVAVVEGSKPGATIAYRADIDALSVNEPNNKDYVSEHEGKMHACGHDGHMTALLGFAKYISENRDKLSGKIVLIFQPAEEGPGGAELMLKAGLTAKYGIEKYIGLHIFPEFEEGKVACKAGPMMARNGEIEIKIKGKGSHGAQPQMGRDAVLAAAAVLLSLNTIISRNISPLESGVVSFGEIHGGTAVNIVAEDAVIRGTMRAFSDDTYEILTSRIEETAVNTAKAYGCNAKVEFNHMYRVINNDLDLTKVLREAVGTENYVESNPYMIAEDFSFYQTERPGLFFFLGSRNEKCGFTAPLHSSEFNFNETILLVGVQTFVNILRVLGLLEK